MPNGRADAKLGASPDWALASPLITRRLAKAELALDAFGSTMTWVLMLANPSVLIVKEVFPLAMPLIVASAEI